MTAITPMHYAIKIKPDLTAFQFSGSTYIDLQTNGSVQQITLNALELTIQRCTVKIGQDLIPCNFVLDEEKETLIIDLPSPMSGAIQVQIEYDGIINDKMAGFYRSRYEVNGQSRYIAVTQFQESDARRAFPCMDHPQQKATFEIELTINSDLMAISNCQPQHETILDDGSKQVRFGITPKMSTYLLFFGVGEFEFIEDVKPVTVRVATLPGKSAYADYGLDFGRKALDYCQDYYGIDYPLDKLDLIAIPDFAFGAMENWGAVTFRENLLLYFPEITSKAGEERICEVIAHEIAHQWFGNLVTPSDWKYLWLNESFATYFGFGAVHHYYPDWGIWDQFITSQTDSALNRDSLTETIPIEIPGGEHVVINSSTAPIIYSKGGSVLRQIEGYIGAEAFQKGLRLYLRAHQYDCATSHHLWEALEEASDKPVNAIMQNWIEQPGYPVIEVHRDNHQLVLTQKRFTFLGHNYDQLWLLPVTFRLWRANGETQTLNILMDSRTQQIDIDEDVVSYKINAGHTGFYRTNYLNKEDLSNLGSQAACKNLSAVDRWGLQNDLFALMRCGDISLMDYLDFLTFYETEEAYLPLISMADNLFYAYLVVEASQQHKIRQRGQLLIENALSQIGQQPTAGEAHTTAILRERLIWQGALYEMRDIIAFAVEQFDRLRHAKSVHPDLLKCVMQVGALVGDHTALEWLQQRFEITDSEHERMNILIAMGCVQQPPLIAATQDYTLTKVPDRNKFISIVSLASNPHAIPFLWQWYVKQVEDLEQFHPLLYERVIEAIVPICGLSHVAEVNEFFADYQKRTDKFEDVIRLALEKLAVNSKLHDTTG